MKKSDLRQIIKEEVKIFLLEKQDTGLSKNAFNWVEDWSWTKKYTNLSSDVEKELKLYRPQGNTKLYRYTEDVEADNKKNLKSFTYELGMVKSIFSYNKKGYVIESVVPKNNILVDITKIPNYEHYFINEVITIDFKYTKSNTKILRKKK